MPSHAITHMYTLRNLGSVAGGQPVTERLALGRFRASHADRPSRPMTVVAAGEQDLCIGAAGQSQAPSRYRWELWHVGHDQALLQIHHLVDGAADALADVLRKFCDLRHELLVDGQPLLDWLRDVSGLGTSPRLMPDVLQLVNYDAALRDDLGTPTAPSSVALGLLHRSTGGFTRTGASRFPAALNYQDHEFAVHGRGVVLLSGHPDDRLSALLLTAAELVVASGRARQARKTVEEELSSVSGALVSGRGTVTTSELQKLSELVRTHRVFLAVEVRAFTDGLFAPEVILDSFRSSFSQSLRLEETTAATESLLDTLTAVLSSYLAEARFKSDADAARRQARWQAIVGLASGVAVPIALVLSYFSVQQDIFDLRRQWPAWAVTLLVSGVIIVVSGIRLWRTRKSAPQEEATT